jgi:predicted outer membrane repeat protein
VSFCHSFHICFKYNRASVKGGALKSACDIFGMRLSTPRQIGDGHVFFNRFGEPYKDTQLGRIPGSNSLKTQHETACKQAGSTSSPTCTWAAEYRSEWSSAMPAWAPTTCASRSAS